MGIGTQPLRHYGYAKGSLHPLNLSSIAGEPAILHKKQLLSKNLTSTVTIST